MIDDNVQQRKFRNLVFSQFRNFAIRISQSFLLTLHSRLNNYLPTSKGAYFPNDLRSC
jgi:hypothetical protein